MNETLLMLLWIITHSWITWIIILIAIAHKINTKNKKRENAEKSLRDAIENAKKERERQELLDAIRSNRKAHN